MEYFKIPRETLRTMGGKWTSKNGGRRKASRSLVREIEEEIGCLITVGEQIEEVEHEYADIIVHLTTYKSSIDSGVPEAIEPEMATGQNSFVADFENLQLNNMSREESEIHLYTYYENFARRGNNDRRRDSSAFTFDYFEALKYKELIDEEIKLKEEDLFKKL
ncbi:hypothetical protein COL82_05700 [Bacillus toyonensis]|nr:hypothetical protein COL82_05700 [Bacillus toyonensis]PGA05948.1 hypothetical protein COL67_16500 [Bacillus toyonensis]PGB38318.1 hypothetical protein COM07_16520 [Bacillus toyonensis]PGB66170.1 hypothetical protein COM00_04460 [Bacillus toyonensis]